MGTHIRRPDDTIQRIHIEDGVVDIKRVRIRSWEIFTIIIANKIVNRYCTQTQKEHG